MTKEVIQQFMWEEICMFRPEMKNKTFKRDIKPNSTAANSNATNAV